MVVATTCSSGHDRHGLLCKMNWEYDFFMKTSKKWVEAWSFNWISTYYPFNLRYWCHFDDDQYVNIPRLVEVLKGYPSTQDWYLGKPSQTIKTYINSVRKFSIRERSHRGWGRGHKSQKFPYGLCNRSLIFIKVILNLIQISILGCKMLRKQTSQENFRRWS